MISEHRRRNLAVLVICSAQMMTVLDVTIVNVALPHIRRDLDITEANLQWVVTVYVLAFGGLLLLGGRAGDLFGRRRMFRLGLTIFTGASLLCGLAVNDVWLIAARAGQGLGAAIAAPAALALIPQLFEPGPDRTRAMGIYAAAFSVGGAVGQLLGGTLVEAGSWRWVFFVNLPIGVFILAMTGPTLPKDETKRGTLDLPGAFTGTAGMATLVYALAHAASSGWGSRVTVLAFVVAAVLLVAFLAIESRHRQPLMPLRVWGDPNRAAAFGVALLVGASITSMYFYITQFVQDVLGYSPVAAGLAFFPLSLGITISAQVTSRVVIGRLGLRPVLLAGLSSLVVGLVWISRITPETSYWTIFGPMMFVAAGLGLTNVPLALLAVARVRHSETGVASALLNATQQVGASLGLATMSTVAATATANELRHLTGQPGPFDHDALPPAVYHAAIATGDRHALLTGAVLCFAALLLAFCVVRIRTVTAPPLASGFAVTPDPADRAGRADRADSDLTPVVASDVGHHAEDRSRGDDG